jgi:F0F1-type ATP synthase beta subunit
MEHQTEWKTIPQEHLGRFIRILNVLNRYYELQKDKKINGLEFRKKIVESNEKGLSVYLKQFGEYEFMVHAKLLDEHGSWIHIDGIAEERKQIETSSFLASPNHPIFEIDCLSDIFADCIESENQEGLPQ